MSAMLLFVFFSPGIDRSGPLSMSLWWVVRLWRDLSSPTHAYIADRNRSQMKKATTAVEGARC